MKIYSILVQKPRYKQLEGIIVWEKSTSSIDLFIFFIWAIYCAINPPLRYYEYVRVCVVCVEIILLFSSSIFDRFDEIYICGNVKR